MSSSDIPEALGIKRGMPDDNFISKLLGRYTDPCVEEEIAGPGTPFPASLTSFLCVVDEYDRKVRESAFAPMCEADGSNPLIKCVEEEISRRKSLLYLKTDDKEPTVINALVSFADDPSKIGTSAVNQSLLVREPNSDAIVVPETLATLACDSLGASIPDESYVRWFTLDATLPKNVSIIAAEVHLKPIGMTVSELATKSGRSKSTADKPRALLTPRRLSETRFELFTNASRESLIDGNSVLVLRVGVER